MLASILPLCIFQALFLYFYFTINSSYDKAFLKLIAKENDCGFFIRRLLSIDNEAVNILEKIYVEDKFPDNKIFSEFIYRYCSANAYKRIAKKVYELEGKELPELPPAIDYEKEEKEASYKYLRCLLDKNEYQNLICELLNKIGDENVSVKDFEEKLYDLDNPLLQKVEFAALRILHQGYKVKNLLNIVDWQMFSTDELYNLFKHESIELKGTQKSRIVEMVLDECQKGILNNAILGDNRFSSHACNITRLLVMLDIAPKETDLSKLTILPWFFFSHDDYKTKFSYLNKKFPKTSLLNQLIFDVKHNNVESGTMRYHIDFLRKYQCKDVVDEIRKICVSETKHYDLSLSAVTYLHDLFGSEYVEFEVIPYCDKDMILIIARSFSDIDCEKLKLSMERLYNKEYDSELQAYLISFNNQKALSDYLKNVRETNSVPKDEGEFLRDTTAAISAVSDPNLIPLLDELAAISFKPDFKDREFGSLRECLYKSFLNCAKTKSDSVLSSINKLLSFSKTDNNIAYCCRLKKDICVEIVNSQDKPCSIKEVKRILSSIRFAAFSE